MESEHQLKGIRPFKFYGQAFEYFKIWIVNIILTILSLGIYSPWAKVRTRRYLYGNTYLDGAAFDFVADPVKILIGRIIAMVFFFLLSLSSLLPEHIEPLVGLLFLFAIPWIVVKSLKFNFYNTTYRNIRFNFHGRYSSAIYIYILLAFLSLITFGLAYPYLIKKQKHFIIARSGFGTSRFNMTAKDLDFYKLFFVPVVIFLVLISIILLFYEQLIHQLPENLDQKQIAKYLVLGFYALLPFLVVIYAYFYTHISNLVINHIQINTFQFDSTLKTSRVTWLFISNILAIMVSFGLLIPWAKIRFMRYRLSCVTLIGMQDLNQFIASETEQTAAIGEELGDLFDIDIGL